MSLKPTLPIDLLESPLDTIVENADPAALLNAIEQITDWDGRPARILDKAYRVILARLLRSRAPVAELSAWSDHLARVTARSRAEILNQEGNYAHRWIAFRDLLEARIAMLRVEVPQSILANPQYAGIVRFVLNNHTVTQSQIGELCLSDTGRANLTRVLNILEAHELIERRRYGRPNRIVPGAKAIHDAALFGASAEVDRVGTLRSRLHAALIHQRANEPAIGRDAKLEQQRKIVREEDLSNKYEPLISKATLQLDRTDVQEVRG